MAGPVGRTWAGGRARRKGPGTGSPGSRPKDRPVGPCHHWAGLTHGPHTDWRRIRQRWRLWRWGWRWRSQVRWIWRLKRASVFVWGIFRGCNFGGGIVFLRPAQRIRPPCILMWWPTTWRQMGAVVSGSLRIGWSRRLWSVGWVWRSRTRWDQRWSCPWGVGRCGIWGLRVVVEQEHHQLEVTTKEWRKRRRLCYGNLETCLRLLLD